MSDLNEKLLQAIGLMTTALPSMVVDAADPVGMARAVVSHVETLRRELGEARSENQAMRHECVATGDAGEQAVEIAKALKQQRDDAVAEAAKWRRRAATYDKESVDFAVSSVRQDLGEKCAALEERNLMLTATLEVLVSDTPCEHTTNDCPEGCPAAFVENIACASLAESYEALTEWLERRDASRMKAVYDVYVDREKRLCSILDQLVKDASYIAHDPNTCSRTSECDDAADDECSYCEDGKCPPCECGVAATYALVVQARKLLADLQEQPDLDELRTQLNRKDRERHG